MTDKFQYNRGRKGATDLTSFGATLPALESWPPEDTVGTSTFINVQLPGLGILSSPVKTEEAESISRHFWQNPLTRVKSYRFVLVFSKREGQRVCFSNRIVPLPQQNTQSPGVQRHTGTVTLR